MRLWLVLLLASLLVPPAVPAQPGADDPGQGPRLEPTLISQRDVLTGSLAVHGDEVVFASPDEGDRVGLWKVNVSTGDEELITSVRGSSGPLGFDSLAYDGRFVVWSDNRTGDLQVYAVDTTSGQFEALTASSSDERQVGLHDGVAVWASWGDFKVRMFDLVERRGAEIGSGAGVGPSSSPAIEGDRIAWAKSQGAANFEIFLKDLASNRTHQLTDDELIQASPSISGDRIAWIEGYPPTASDKPDGTRVVVSDLVTSETAPITPGYGRFDDPVIAGDLVAWRIPTSNVAIHHLPQRQTVIIPSPGGTVSDVAMTPSLLAVTYGGPNATHVYAVDPGGIFTAAQEAGGSSINWPMAAAGGTLMLGGIGFGLWKRRQGVEGS